MRVVELVHFGKFPVCSHLIEISIDTCSMLANDSYHPYQPFRSLWFEIALQDPGAFQVTLGNAAAYWAKIKPHNSVAMSSEVSNHYALSVKHLRHRLNNFTESISEGAIANILAHICLNV